MNLFLFLFQSSWKMVTIAIITGLLSGSSSAALIALISRSVSQGSGAAIAPVLWGFVGLALVAGVANFLSQVVLIRLSQNAVFQLRMRLSRQILASDLHHLEQVGTPRLLATLTEDVQAITTAVHAIPFLCIDAAIVVGCLTYLLWLYWSIFLAVFGFMTIALCSCLLLVNRGKRLMARVREEQDALFQHFRTVTEGIKELKLHHQRRQDFLTNDLQAAANAFRRDNVRSLTLFAITSSWGQFLLFFAIGLVMFVLPHLIRITPQTLAGYILTFTYLMLPMDNLVNNLPHLSRANVALQKIASLRLSLDQQTETTSEPPTANADWQRLEVKGVTHAYRGEQEDSNFAIGPINLTLRSRELVFIVGGNGSGKSTLAKLLTGLYIPEAGEILLDGQPITHENREWYRQHFSVVFADFYVFDRLLGINKSMLGHQVQTYLKQLQLDHKVKVENGILSTTALSQGQRKRLALLTAYLEDRSIYLFDEWAADQDPVFKELFYTQFLPDLRSRGKTVLVISHDDHYFHLADRLIKLNYGTVEYDKAFKIDP